MRMDNIKKEFITDSKGNKKAVIIPMEEYSKLLEDLEDLAAIAERRKEPTRSMDELLKELKEDGLI